MTNLVSSKVLQKAVIINSQGKMLGLKRTENYPGGSRPGKWDLPGGSLDLDDLEAEKPHLSAILREVQEETGISEISTTKVVFVDSLSRKVDDQEIMILAIGYKITIEETEVVISSEHSKYLWFTQEELLAQDFGDDGGFHKSIIRSTNL